MERSKLAQAAGVVTALVTIIGGAWAVENHFATRIQVAEVSSELRQHKVSGALYDNRRETWQYEDRLKAHPNDETAKQRLRQLEYERKMLEEEQKQLKKGYQ